MAKNKQNTPAVKPTVGVNSESVAPAVEEAAVVTDVVETPIASVVEEAAVVTDVVETPIASVVEEAAVVTDVVETPIAPVAEEAAVVTDVVETPIAQVAEESHDAVLIPSGIFIAEDGQQYEFAVESFLFQGKKYTKETALINHADVLEHLVSLKSFILKKV